MPTDRPVPAAGASDDGAGSATVADLGEDALLARIFPLLPPSRHTLLGPGDDAAVVAAPDGRVVVSTDVLVEGRHFRREWSDGADVGWRAAVQNLADIAAMGARPTGLVVSLVAPPDLPVAWALDLARGLNDACRPVGAGVVGGDLSGGRDVVVSVTVLGDLGGHPPVRRDGARPGDVVAHAGVRGWSAAGLALLTAEVPAALDTRGSQDDPPLVGALVDAYLRPDPPLAAGPSAARHGATAMLDVSDGLLRDAGRLARAGGVVVDLDEPQDVFAEDLERLEPVARRLGASARTWVLTGGEDHGLLATFPSDVDVPSPFRVIGRVRQRGGHGAPDVLVGGRPPDAGASGWDHFRR